MFSVDLVTPVTVHIDRASIFKHLRKPAFVCNTYPCSLLVIHEFFPWQLFEASQKSVYLRSRHPGIPENNLLAEKSAVRNIMLSEVCDHFNRGRARRSKLGSRRPQNTFSRSSCSRYDPYPLLFMEDCNFLQLCRADVTIAIGNFFRTRNLQSLAGFDCLDKQ